MNATDFMLGDYVQIEDEKGNLITDYICDIGYVSQWNELGVKTCKCGDEWLRESEIVPILLTAEILEKIATRTPGYLVWVLEGCNGAEVQLVPSTLDIINPAMEYRLAPRQKCFGVQDTLICHLKYVHELQHALKLCGINKEIIL